MSTTKRIGRTPRGESESGLEARIATLARNLWWTWNTDAQRLFGALDPVLWEATKHNPIEVLARLAPERRAAAAQDAAFVELLRHCEAALTQYLRAKTWFSRTATAPQKRLSVAYFCAEFGLHECLPQYAGGLGVLAGDHLKSASDLGVPLVGVGLLYRSGYYQQSFDASGNTRVAYPRYDFERLPISDTRKSVNVPMGRRSVGAKIWEVLVGRVPLYLLDTDVPGNRPRDRAITQTLYGGDQDTRIRQEIVLGIGGVMALEALGVRATVFHLNEGHAAFCTLARLRQVCAGGLSLERSTARVRQTTVFTTHTPVAAGHDRFPRELVMRYLGPLAESLNLSKHCFLALGRENADARREPFCMTVLALQLAARCNGVSKLHGQVSREMWTHVYRAATPREVPIGHVTNGVHAQTWLAPEMEPLYRRHLKPRWVGAGPEDDWWRHAARIPASELWKLRRVLRARLVNFIRARLVDQIRRGLGPVDDLIAAHDTFDEHTLTIGFARRFATYKRAPLIFYEATRLAKILSDPKRPVQLVFAGKAHPRDAGGQALVREVYQLAKKAGFRGRVALLENYDMHVGRVLTAGCDVWLNNPLRPQEASGTSGMKPPLHGGLNCSILDGWWPEAYNGRNGWAIGDAKPQRNRRMQDRHDATAIYQLLEHEIVPLFYERNRAGLPQRWIRRMQESMKAVCGPFHSHRMVSEYVNDYYLPSLGAPPSGPRA